MTAADRASTLARLEVDGWELESAEARHAAAPATFRVPPETQRQSLRIGQAAKLIFRIRLEDQAAMTEIATERMWVIVTGRSGRVYEGRLQNQSATTPDFGPGTVVHFLSEHVADIDEPPADYEPL